MTRTRTGLLVLLSSATFTLAIAGCGGSKSSSAPGPGVASLTPSTGTISTIVTIAGSSFSSPTVTFTAGGSSYQAQVTAASDTSVDVVVPSVPTNLAAAGTAFDVAVANAGGGSTTVSHGFTMTAPTLADINGGLAGSGSAGTPFIVDGDDFGDPAVVTTGFSVDFTDPVTSTVTSAVVADGDWTTTYVVATVPNSLTPGTTYNVTVTTPSGTSASRTFQIVSGVPFNPSQIAWASTSSLPTAQQGFSTLIAPIGGSTYVYAIGGNTAAPGTSGGKSQDVKTVYMNRMNSSTGALMDASWSTTITPLPQERGFAAAVVANALNSLVSGNGNLYVLGGLDSSGAATSTVYYTSVKGDGTIPASGSAGTWATTTPLPQALFAAGAVLFHGRIYVAGGNDSSGLPVAKVYSAKINGNGTLGDWQSLPDMPEALAYHQLVTLTGYLYALGGDTAFDPVMNDTVAVDPIASTASGACQSAVYYAHVNIRNGAFSQVAGSDWTSTLGMTKAHEKFTAVAAGDYVLLSGGLYGNSTNGSSEELYGEFNSDGTIKAWNGATGSHTVYDTSGGAQGGEVFYNHSATYFVDAGGTPHVLLLGGGNLTTGNLDNRVWYQTN